MLRAPNDMEQHYDVTWRAGDVAHLLPQLREIYVTEGALKRKRVSLFLRTWGFSASRHMPGTLCEKARQSAAGGASGSGGAAYGRCIGCAALSSAVRQSLAFDLRGEAPCWSEISLQVM